MVKILSKIWAYISHTDTGISVLGRFHLGSATLIAGGSMLIAWLSEQPPIVLFMIGLGAFALMVVIFERLHRRRAQSKLETATELAHEPQSIGFSVGGDFHGDENVSTGNKIGFKVSGSFRGNKNVAESHPPFDDPGSPIIDDDELIKRVSALRDDLLSLEKRYTGIALSEGNNERHKLDEEFRQSAHPEAKFIERELLARRVLSGQSLRISTESDVQSTGRTVLRHARGIGAFPYGRLAHYIDAMMKSVGLRNG